MGLFLALMAMAFFSFWGYLVLGFDLACQRPAVRVRHTAAVEKHPQLKTDWDQAMQDDVLTQSEAEAIVEAGEKQSIPEPIDALKY